MSKKSTTKKCAKCAGTGRVIDPKKVCPQLKESRESAGITLKQLSNEIGIALSTIDSRENAKSKRPVTLKFIQMHTRGIAAILDKRKSKQ